MARSKMNCDSEFKKLSCNHKRYSNDREAKLIDGSVLNSYLTQNKVYNNQLLDNEKEHHVCGFMQRKVTKTTHGMKRKRAVIRRAHVSSDGARERRVVISTNKNRRAVQETFLLRSGFKN